MRKMMIAALLAGVAWALPMPSAAAAFLVTAENPGVQNTTSTFSYKGVETFDARTSTGLGATTGFTTSFGGTSSSSTGITGTYAGVSITAADQYGGAGGTGQYATAYRGGQSAPVSYTLDLTTTRAQGINYFGYWLSAADAGNVVSFSKNGAVVYTFSTADFLNLAGASYYKGNPNNGGDQGEAFAFINFYDRDDTFDRVTFSQVNAYSGYESDNHTVGRYLTTSGTQVAAIPEPASWATMILGFGVIGGVLRARRARGALAVGD